MRNGQSELLRWVAAADVGDGSEVNRLFANDAANVGGNASASLSGTYATEKFPGLAAYNDSKHGVVGLMPAQVADLIVSLLDGQFTPASGASAALAG